MADDHAQPLLEEDNNPSWVTLPQENSKNNKAAAGSSGSSVASSPWDQAAARISAARPGGSGIGWADAPQNDEKEDDLPRIVLMMRLGNLGAAALLIFGSVGNVLNIFSLSKMVLGGYGVCFGTLVCCLEVNLSFLRKPIASNFGFLYSPFLRLMFYALMGMVAWSFNTILGMIAAAALGLLSLVNTYVLCRYPGYRAALKEIGDEEERRLKREGARQLWKNRAAFSSLPWWEV